MELPDVEQLDLRDVTVEDTDARILLQEREGSPPSNWIRTSNLQIMYDESWDCHIIKSFLKDEQMAAQHERAAAIAFLVTDLHLEM